MKRYGARRRALGIQSVTIAAALGVSKFTYSGWELGRDPVPPARAEQIEFVLREYEQARARIAAKLGRKA